MTVIKNIKKYIDMSNGSVNVSNINLNFKPVSGNNASVKNNSVSNSELLLEACGNGDISKVEYLLTETNADVNFVKGQYTPLVKASENGHAGIVSLLLKNGANPNLQNPLFAAIYKENIGIVTQLILKGANVNASDNGVSPLILATNTGNADIVNMLVRHDANLKFKNKNGKTAYNHACKYKYGNVKNELTAANSGQSHKCSISGGKRSRRNKKRYTRRRFRN
jgi:ankyrin repeat protein